jgi:hypothetical protein
LKEAPSLDDELNKAEKYNNTSYNPEDTKKDYVIIEDIVQISGYHYSSEDIYAKRPFGAVISRSIIKNQKIYN